MFFKSSFFIGIFIVLLAQFAQAKTTKPSQDDFDIWKKDFAQTLVEQHKISPTLVNHIIVDAKLNPHIIKKDKNQLHKKVSLDTYLKRVLSKARSIKGKGKYKKHHTALKDAEQTHKVDASVIVALWGVESFYGERQGKHIISDALLTLIYEGRREKFFTKELLHILAIMQEQRLQKEEIKGSWAGAMGATQFMPSSYTHYAYDGNNDGKKNIWNDHADIFHSAANYLHKNRYKFNEPIAIEVKPHKSVGKSYAMRDWQKKSIIFKDQQEKIPNAQLQATLKKYKNRYFLVFRNFKAIKRWNNADYFALSVALLAKDIAQP